MTPSTPFRFGPCELDEARRSLRALGREIRLQPRVFDLLCYLVRHRDRVVPKDELLEALWPGTVVVDNALQRAVSLARAALAEAGLRDVLRTYPRNGYRFCMEGCDDGAPVPATRVLVDRARTACDANDWPAACAAFAEADAQGLLGPGDVEDWGRAAICAGIGPSAAPALERSVAQRDAAGDVLGAARATLLLVQIRIDHKEGVAARGLLQRASRYLDGQDAVPERGHYAWMASRMAMGSGDNELALTLADEACTLGRRLRNADVECLGLAYRGHALVARGEVAAGLAHHEEAAAVIRLGGVQPWVAGWALCSILYAARYRCDWLRAAQFASAYDAWSRSCNMPAFPGTCQLHRAAVLGVQGELARALDEVRGATELLARVAPWAEGDAYCVQGEIQLLGGDFAGAEASFRQAHALGWDPQPGLARLHLATGQPALALGGLQRALEETDWTLCERRGQMLCLLVHAALAAGQPERAREALATLAQDAALLPTEALEAMHGMACAELALHDGDTRRGVQQLRQAARQWREVGSPQCEAEARLRLAEALLHQGDSGGAELELETVQAQLAPVSPLIARRVQALRQGAAAAA